MAESLDVLGVIGTWIAAALAVIALAGILPIYLLYRQSKTDRYMALNSVHDPQNAYITPGYLLWPGERFFRTYRVPQLERPQTGLNSQFPGTVNCSARKTPDP
jgi:hypothetical protein